MIGYWPLRGYVNGAASFSSGAVEVDDFSLFGFSAVSCLRWLKLLVAGPGFVTRWEKYVGAFPMP